ncbi:hypothetical protein RDI58_017007 [Solanum bulbocastanum]|uniref:Uncharacterized protein n=1 Tax=Solanum bulbocastanum TaxID=147425 RepID=A0AAN8YBJ8_SOLBU
MVVPFLLCK